MRGLKAYRVKIKVGEFWETPSLHILLTKEDDVIVARCLDFAGLPTVKMKRTL